jgi:hypothetical protein
MKERELTELHDVLHEVPEAQLYSLLQYSDDYDLND